MSKREVVIVGGSRIPFTRSMTKYMAVSNQKMLSACVQSIAEKYSLSKERIGEVVLGAVMKRSRDWNMAREVVLDTTLSPSTPAFDIQQACGTGLEAAILVANKIALGQIDAGIAGGADTNSDLPVVYPDKFSHIMLDSFRGKSAWDKMKPFMGLRPGHFKPVFPAIQEPRTGLSMGESCELMAKRWSIARTEQDEIAFNSHQNAVRAQHDGFFDDLVISFEGVDRDSNVRPDTSMERLAKLKPAFDRSEKGTLTAGNSSALTDGASAVLLASEEWAKERGLPILAYFRHCQTAAVDYVNGEEGLLMAPVYAVSEMLNRANISLQDFDYYEIHEAFAAQVLCTLKAWENPEYCRANLGRDEPLGSIDRAKMNVNGGSIAIGHPFAATGGRILASLSKMLHTKGSGRGLISICTAGGMGVSAVIEK